MSGIIIKEAAPESVPQDLLLEADPSWKRIQRYLPKSRCFAAMHGERIVGIYVLMRISTGVHELMNIAVAPDFQKKGIGTQLLQHAIENARNAKGKRMEIGTGTFGYQLAFYQKAGFRATEILKDHFVNNYPESIFEDGIRHKDMLRLVLNL